MSINFTCAKCGNTTYFIANNMRIFLYARNAVNHILWVIENWARNNINHIVLYANHTISKERHQFTIPHLDYHWLRIGESRGYAMIAKCIFEKHIEPLMAKVTGVLDILIKKQEISFFLLFFYYIFLLPITMEDAPCGLPQFL